MVDENKDFIFTTCQILILNLDSFNNNQKLAIVNFVSSLYKNHFWKEKSY